MKIPQEVINLKLSWLTQRNELQTHKTGAVHSPECFQMLSIDDVRDLCQGQDTGALHYFPTQTVCMYKLCVLYACIYTMRTHRIQCPQTALALAQWSVWWLPLWHHGADPADLWSHSSALSVQVQSQTFGGTCTIHTQILSTTRYLNASLHVNWQKQHDLWPFNDVTCILPGVNHLLWI